MKVRELSIPDPGIMRNLKISIIFWVVRFVPTSFKDHFSNNNFWKLGLYLLGIRIIQWGKKGFMAGLGFSQIICNGKSTNIKKMLCTVVSHFPKIVTELLLTLQNLWRLSRYTVSSLFHHTLSNDLLWNFHIHTFPYVFESPDHIIFPHIYHIVQLISFPLSSLSSSHPDHTLNLRR